MGGSGKAEREERLAAALRDNLRRRKAAARQRSAEAGAGGATDADAAPAPDAGDPTGLPPEAASAREDGRASAPRGLPQRN